MANTQPPAIFLLGPTASGKSDLAMKLTSHLPVELVSVDSALVYRDMNIGTAKPDAEILRQYPHHLVDIRNPDEVYSAADFRSEVLTLMSAISERGNIPLLVGGTMLYFKVLIEGIASMPAADSAIREKIVREAETGGWQKVHQRLAEVDPESAARIHPNDPQRLQRALEIWELTGESMTQLHKKQQNLVSLPFSVCQLAIIPSDRADLHRIIAARFEQMIKDGFIEEVEHLREKYDLNAELPSIKSVGYRQVWQYLEGEVDRKAMQERAIIATRQLAKRQFTWLRGWSNLKEIPFPEVNEALKIIQASSILS
ncbi:MAG: tRNA (adenosine(37)-N6)-dimethylallyltransferase MiaA [Pseudomonadales bacterium]|jgi:tRNA dimethylallyltransferase|nr:tRNA (adenosine(37)-N6)-dimethylallyltransferase MiaA [Gammaproteobacteria bacterium]MDB3988378.1 tRNA (adenosine(37)-N6)-dimethylallyltransferase MiaA [Pseudomonadales bacterium]MBT3734007.1 tRNA (adenosine(37)-N6)-dimethylallyltransferase MiaA [Gammaproteobacteria bacterium]MDG0999512.1 tRNA (adenosine(37)-N6)-dimethylallyltransferase MiaA [Pseudomonadales bacterium]MDG1303296.1 tRNA (adenosine(37)-N6)-dimethylallyltransferase MiaA [Pseudomonadales bacterium]